jgi:hypothetical protein
VPPLPFACVPPPPHGTKGGGGQHSLVGEGAGELIRTTGEKAWHSVYRVGESENASLASVTYLTLLSL